MAGYLVIFRPWSLLRLVHDANCSTALVIAMTVTATTIAVYLVSLRASYRFAPVALVYPIARSSPLLIAVCLVLATLLSIFAFREREYWRTRLAAVVVITIGIVCVGFAR